MKILARVKRTEKIDGVDVETEKIEAFSSPLEFETFERAAALTAAVKSVELLSKTEIEEFLAPFKAAVISADLRKAEARKILEDCATVNKALFEMTGPGYMFQDADGTVYKTEVCDGKFVYFEPVEIKRTRRTGEVKGTLSMKEAEAAGFQLPDTKNAQKHS